MNSMDKMHGLVELLRQAKARDGALIETLEGVITGQPLDAFSPQELARALSWLGDFFTLRYGAEWGDSEAQTLAAMRSHEDRFEEQQEIVEERLEYFLMAHPAGVTV